MMTQGFWGSDSDLATSDEKLWMWNQDLETANRSPNFMPTEDHLTCAWEDSFEKDMELLIQRITEDGSIPAERIA